MLKNYSVVSRRFGSMFQNQYKNIVFLLNGGKIVQQSVFLWKINVNNYTVNRLLLILTA